MCDGVFGNNACVREKPSVAQVAHVLLLHFVAGNVDVNTLASKRSELIGNAAIVRKRRVIHNKSTCVCLRLPIAAITQKRTDASFDLWPALGRYTPNSPGQTQEWLLFQSWGVDDRLHIYTMYWLFYFPWHRHQIEGTDGF